MSDNWALLRKRLDASSAGPRQTDFFSAMAKRGEAAEAAGRLAAALHCRRRVESFLAFTEGKLNFRPERTGGAEAHSPLEALGERLGRKARSRAKAVLSRYGHRLTPAERSLYDAGIQSGDSARLPALRRRMVARLLRSVAPRPQGENELGSGLAQEPGDYGPYNDRVMVAEVLRRAAQADPQWVRELGNLYAGLERLRRRYREFLPPRSSGMGAGRSF